MKYKYVIYLSLAFVGILLYNVALAKRDQKMFDSYDHACAQLTQPNPNCIYAK